MTQDETQPIERIEPPARAEPPEVPAPKPQKRANRKNGATTIGFHREAVEVQEQHGLRGSFPLDHLDPATVPGGDPLAATVRWCSERKYACTINNDRVFVFDAAHQEEFKKSWTR